MSDAIAIPVKQGSAAWLESRLDGIGSSDAPIIAGERGSVVALWAIKTRQLEPEPIDEETQRLFDFGHRLEPIIAEAYTERTDRPLRRVNRLLRRRDTRWALASLDRVSARRGERRIVELKTSPFTRWSTSGEAVPGDVQAQVQHQLWVTGYDVADVAVLIRGYDLRIVEIERDAGFIDDLVYLEREFWRQVVARERPAVDGSEETRRALARMFPAEYGEILPATPELDLVMTELRSAIAQAKDANDREATLRNALRAMLDDAAGVKGYGYSVSYRATKATTTTEWEAVARDLGATAPRRLARALERHTTTRPGPRQLRPTWSKGGAATTTRSDEEES